MNLARFALRNPITILMAVLGSIILGVISFSKLPVDMFPEISYPTITVAIFYPGANPQDIERTVTYPVEKAVSTVNGVKYVSSISRQGTSVVTIFFNWGTNLDSAQSDVLQAVNLIHGDLPEDVKYPIIRKFDVSQISVIFITLMGGGLTQGELYDLAYNVVEPEIEHVPNVASARVGGGKIREILIHFDRQRMQAFNLSPEAIIRAVQQANLILPSGDIKAGLFDYRLFTETQFSVVKPIENIIVSNVRNQPVYLRDVAEVLDDFQEQTNIIRVNGQPAVSLSVQKTSGTNTIQVVDDIRKALPKIKKLLPPGVEMLELFDQSVYIRNSITNLQHEALIGAVLAVLVILIFLRNVRSTVIVSLSIPISIVCAFSLLYFNNLSLNVFTLGGLALGVGRLVDDAIVVLENIFRHRIAGKNPYEASIQGSGEVGMAVLASTVTTIVVFLPVVFVTGIARLLFTPLALTVAFSLIASYFVSLTVIPVLTRKYLHPEEEEALPPSPTAADRWKWKLKLGFDRIDASYQSVLSWALRHRKTVVISVLAVLFGSLPLYFFIGTEFFPSMDESQFRFWVQLPVGTRIEESEKVAARMEEVIHQTIGTETKAIQVNFGMPSGTVSAVYSQNTGPHMGWIRCRLVEPGERKLSSDELMDKLRPRLIQEFPGVKVFFTSGGIVRMLISFGNENPIDVEILGYDLKIAEKLAEEVASLVRSTPGAKDVRVSREQDYPQQNIRIDRERAALLGLSVAQVARAVQTFVNGFHASIFSDPKTGNQYYITVRAQEKDRASLSDLSQIFIFNPAGQAIPLDNIAEISSGAGPDPDRAEIPAADHPRHGQQLRPGPGERGCGDPVQDRPAESPPEFQDQRERRGGEPEGVVHCAARGLSPGDRPGLHGPRLPVQVPARPLHHHVLRAPRADRRPLGPVPDRDEPLRHVLHGRHHDGGHRGEQRDPADRLHEPAAWEGDEDRGGRDPGGEDETEAHPHDHPLHHPRSHPDGGRSGRGVRVERAHGDRGHRRPDDLHPTDPGLYPDALHHLRGPLQTGDSTGRNDECG